MSSVAPCCEESSGQQKKWEHITQQVLMTMEERSPFFEANPPTESLPLFDPREVQLGEVLGEGDFGTVRAVVHVTDDSRNQLRQQLHNSLSFRCLISSSHQKSNHEIEDMQEERANIQERCWRDGKARYAVKRAREDLKGEERLTAVLDLAAEAKILASINHPNIIRLRAIAGRPGTSDFMVVLDRLQLTLTEQMKLWKRSEPRGIFGFRVRRNSYFRQMLVERVTTAFDVARALCFLHTHKILFRDVKPDNCGLDVRRGVKLYDFGIARELKKEDLVKLPDDYNCTGCTGTRIYMAPEVCLAKPYGLKSDVYSFGVLLWELCQLKKPFNFSREKHLDWVVQKGFRPRCPAWIPNVIRNMINDCWHEDASKRPSFENLCQHFPNCIVKVERRSRRESLLDRSNFLRSGSKHSMQGFLENLRVELEDPPLVASDGGSSR